MSNLIARALQAFPRIPKNSADDVTTCIICGCTDRQACPGGCSWSYTDLEGEWGLCSACEEGKLCMAAVMLVASALEGERWKRKDGCPCPLCKKPTGRKK